MKRLPLSKYIKTFNYAMTNKLARECIYPFYASFKVTHKCSLKCEFCNVWMEKTPDLKTEDVFKVIDNIANSSIIVLSIEGGDPLVRKDLGDILQYAYKKPFTLFFTTNGHLLDKRPIKEYGKYIDYLHISIDEGHGNLDFFNRLEEFQSYGPEICIQIVVTK
jgi:MoaA/NifB/PqqE/SkfB family radical SAM enzyme